MVSIHNNTFLLLAFLIMLAGTVSTADATEITGTLSSDGSNEVRQGTIEGTNVAGVATPHASGTLQGSVVGGTDSAPTGSARTDSPSWIVLAWIATLGIALTTIIFLLRRDKVT